MEAEHALLEALAIQHEPSLRELFRSRLARAIDLAERAGARSILAEAHTVRAEDARHGAGQISLGAQRAPTLEACDDGWQRVSEIVAIAEESARIASTARAIAAARSARKLIEERNNAYTFHAERGFSFGEGWYVAAACVLAGITIQIEPNKDGTAQAERFLRDAGLAAQLQVFRSRPRAPKHLTSIIADAFRSDPTFAQEKLRAAFLGDGPLSPAVVSWTERELASAPAAKKVLLWIRVSTHHPWRNTTAAEIAELVARAHDAGLVPILFGDALAEVPSGAIDLTLGWREPIFQADDGRRAQLHLFEHLRRTHGLVGQLGVTTAGMDGPALMGLPTMYLTDATNVRMREWEGAVPGYREVVRDAGYLDRIRDALIAWAGV